MLDDLLATWPKAGFIDPTRLAIVAHSRGGQTARYLADRLKGGADPWTVRAVVGLASKGGSDMPLDGARTTGLLLLHGSQDFDQPPARSYERHDGSGTEETVPLGQADAIYRSMKLLEGGHHNHFSERDSGWLNQASVAKGYVLAFLAAHLQGDMTWYEDYIRGDAVPHGWPQAVVSQVSDGFLRKMIDNFEDGLVGASTIGGAVSKTADVSASVLDLAGEADAQHDTRALRMYGRHEGESITWSIPAAHGDTSAYKWLSMRIGQTSGAPTAAVRVQLRNNGVWSPEVPLGDHGAVPSPMMMCVGGPYNCLSPVEFDHMGTVRVPLSAFGAHNDVEAVRFVFRGASVRKYFLLDSLEFSEWIFKP